MRWLIKRLCVIEDNTAHMSNLVRIAEQRRGLYEEPIELTA